MSGWDAAVLASLALGGLLYAGRCAARAHGRACTAGRARVFLDRWTAMLAAIAPPLDRAATLRFSAHMAHALLMLIGAPLLIARDVRRHRRAFLVGAAYGRYGRLAYGVGTVRLYDQPAYRHSRGVFAFSRAAFYPLYASRAAAEGIDALGDQQLAGLYMWIPAGAIFMLFGLALVMAWLSESERRATLGSPLPTGR